MVRRFRVGFSYSRAIQDRIAPIAHELARIFGINAVLYDRFHEAEFARGNLAFVLPSLYKESCDLVVAVFDPSYSEKEWTGLEWNVIFSLHKAKQFERVMLLSIGLDKPDELHDLDGTLDVSARTNEQVTTLILERLALNEGRDRNHYLREGSAPASCEHMKDDKASSDDKVADILRDELYFTRRESNGRNRLKSLHSITQRADLLPTSHARFAELRISAWRQLLGEARFFTEYKEAFEGLHRAFDCALVASIPKSEKWGIVRALSEAAVDISQSAPGAIELNKIALHLNSAIKQISALLGLKPEQDHAPERLAEFFATRGKCKRALATVLNRRTQASKEIEARVKSLRQEAHQDATKAKDIIANEFTLHECALALFAISASPTSDNARAGLEILQRLAQDSRNVLATYEYVRQLKLRHRYLDAMNVFCAVHGNDADKRRFDANLSNFVGSIIGLHYNGSDPAAVKVATVDAINWLEEAINAEHHRARDIIDYCYMLAIAAYPIEQYTAPLREITYNGTVDWSVIGEMSYDASRGEETLREALLLGLEDALIWSRMGTLHFDFTKNYAQAIIFYDQAIHLDPKSPLYHYNKARALAHGIRDFQAAKYSLAQARRLAKYMWGWFTINRDQFDDLEKEIDENEPRQ